MNGLTSIRYEGVCDGNDGACVCVLAKMLMKNWSANVREKKRWIYYFMPIIKFDGGNEFGYGFDLWLIGIMHLVEFVCGTNDKENSWKNGVIILIDFRTIAWKTRTSFVTKCTKWIYYQWIMPMEPITQEHHVNINNKPIEKLLSLTAQQS